MNRGRPRQQLIAQQALLFVFGTDVRTIKYLVQTTNLEVVGFDTIPNKINGP